MSDYGIYEFEPFEKVAGKSIMIRKVTPKFIIFDCYNECGDLWMSNVRKKVKCDAFNSLYINFTWDNYPLQRLNN